MTTAQSRADAQDRNSPDHLPVCPTCHEPQSARGRWCNACGVWLHLDGPKSSAMRQRALDAAAPRDLDSRARMSSHESSSTPPAGEAMAPANGTGS